MDPKKASELHRAIVRHARRYEGLHPYAQILGGEDHVASMIAPRFLDADDAPRARQGLSMKVPPTMASEDLCQDPAAATRTRRLPRSIHGTH